METKAGPDEIVIKVKACAISTTDVLVRGHYLSDIVSRVPTAPGYEISGIAIAVGDQISHICVNDEVVGLIPIDSHFGGCCEITVQSGFNFFKKPIIIPHEDAAGCIGPGLKAYSALNYAGHLVPGENVLILSGSSAFGHIAVQLAAHWGGNVITTANSVEEVNYLNDLPTKFARIVNTETEDVREAVMRETGGLGVDLVIETDIRDIEMGSPCVGTDVCTENVDKYFAAKKPTLKVSDILACLAVHGRWISSRPGLQLDPPFSQILWRKSATISFAFEQSWVLSSTEQGRYLHILQDLLKLVEKDEILPKITRLFPLDKLGLAFDALKECSVGRVVVQLR